LNLAFKVMMMISALPCKGKRP